MGGSYLHVAVVQDSYRGFGLHNQASSESVQDKVGEAHKYPSWSGLVVTSKALSIQDKVGEAHLLAVVQYAHESLNPDGNVKK